MVLMFHNFHIVHNVHIDHDIHNIHKSAPIYEGLGRLGAPLITPLLVILYGVYNL